MFVLIQLDCFNRIPLNEWFKQQKLISVLEAGSPRSRAGKDLPPGFQMSLLLLCPHIIFLGCMSMGRYLYHSFSSYKVTNPIRLGNTTTTTSKPHLTSITF